MSEFSNISTDFGRTALHIVRLSFIFAAIIWSTRILGMMVIENSELVSIAIAEKDVLPVTIACSYALHIHHRELGSKSNEPYQ